jgi:7-carboxy-7-deazaguanine synthase
LLLAFPHEREQKDYGNHLYGPAHVIPWVFIGLGFVRAFFVPKNSCPNVHKPSDLSLVTYPVMECFSTVQGEGAFAGHAAYFIRLAGCDVGCTWCDVKPSWDRNAHPLITVGDLVDRALAHPTRIVVVTGGEPLMHALSPLTRTLRMEGFRTHLETSGAYPLSGEWHHICLSPKKFKPALPEVLDVADELKVVVNHKHDLVWAQTHAGRVRPNCQLYLQPEWEKREAMMPLIVDHVIANPQWQVSLQTHKYLNIP